MVPLPIYSLSQVSYKTAEGNFLLKGIDLQLYPGEILTIAGPNGAGKTTLLKVMSGQLTATRGEVHFSSVPLNTFKQTELAKNIGVISQSEQPDPRLTVREYVSLGGIPHEQYTPPDQRRAEVEKTLLLFSLEGFSEKRMDSLSGGERQRIFIARSVCQKPQVLFLDEPTNHLDPRAKGEILSTISSLGITIVAVLHELSPGQVPSLAGRVSTPSGKP